MSLEMTILLTGGVVVGVTLLAVLILAGPRLLRSYVISTGAPARATILQKRLGRWATYSKEDGGNMLAQQVILSLQVYPAQGAPYVAEDTFMAKMIDLRRLNEGCDIQVRIARNNPQRVVCLPETVAASANAPVAARAGVAMANFAEQVARGGPAGAEHAVAALQAQGIQPRPLVQDDPKAKIAKLKEMLDSGLITPQEFEAKKREILARM
jgi:hypothetical protein